jgi:NAD(P)-dependent dehydrogenase (short-subunit alcohol dehydrogenase family)
LTPSESLSGRTALITGSTSGIGEATALLLARRGALVIVTGRDADRGAAVVKSIRDSGCTAEFIQADLHDGASATALARQALGVFDGRIDILVNNAAMSAFGATEGFDEKTLDLMFGVNLKVPFYLVAALAPAMAARAQGSIVNVSSIAASSGLPGIGLYGASKIALELMTRSWAAEYGPSGVRVNGVRPGATLTPPVSAMGEQALEQMSSQSLLRRMGRPEELAEAIAFLAGDGASYINGVVVGVDGGISS